MMHPKRKRRLIFIVLLLIGLGAAIALVLYALKQNINLYFTPAQLAENHVQPNQTFRLGGMVKKGSIEHQDSSLKVSFIVTDFVKDMQVFYEGILPDLFRDGQGVVVQGKLDEQGKFIAYEVLAKHDEKYMPKVVKDSLHQVQIDKKNSSV